MGWLEFMTKNLYNTQGKVINKVVETLQHMDQEMAEEEENKQIKVYFWSLWIIIKSIFRSSFMMIYHLINVACKVQI